MPLTKLSLFSGIGGDDLASDWAGIKTVCFVEREPYCQKVLKKHWPEVPIIEDIKNVNGCDFTGVDIISGGFPCQDISNANTQGALGLNGERSGLWTEYKRLVSEIRPRYVVVENVSALLYRGLGQVLGDLYSIGYDAEWITVSAEDVGAPHIRKRVFIVSYPRGKFRVNQFVLKSYGGEIDSWTKDKEKWCKDWEFAEMESKDLSRLDNEWAKRNCNPDFLRISDGIPNQLDRLKGLGNAVVPQQVYPVYKAIVEIENERTF